MQKPANERFRARVARTPQDVRAAQALRHQAFFGGEGLDRDRFDDICTHVLIEDTNSGQLACCFRLLSLGPGVNIDQSYSAQFYDLSAFHRFPGNLAEMGRFCVAPGKAHPDALRAAWGALTRYVDENEIEMLIGCASFKGTDASDYKDAFAMLFDRYHASPCWRAMQKMPSAHRFANAVPRREFDERKALAQLPPLLRVYLSMGGWVGDHAVPDPHLHTLHVFTGLEISAIPARRKQVLRAIAQELDAPQASG